LQGTCPEDHQWTGQTTWQIQDILSIGIIYNLNFLHATSRDFCSLQQMYKIQPDLIRSKWISQLNYCTS
jgi:hypothetical protein